MESLIKQAGEVYNENFNGRTWYGRCIFLSWYCEVSTCKFCFRSTQKHRIRHAKTARRTISSILVEAILCRKLGWRIEFLTGGYGIFSNDELVRIASLVSKAYGEKIWLNLGVIKPDDLELFRPFTKGIVSSIECINPELHKKICPDKPIQPYEDMFNNSEGFMKSMTIVIGLGEKREDFTTLAAFIRRHNLDRITFYALKPVPGTAFEDNPGPKTSDYLWWIARTRIEFPKLEIIAGTTPRRYEEVGRLLEAGANAFTKFPATKMFGSEGAFRIESDIKKSGRKMEGTITALPENIDWNSEVENIGLDKDLEDEVKVKLESYLSRMQKSKN